jgi:hypothetical protein
MTANTIISMPVLRFDKDSIIGGSIVEQCTRCGCDAWVSIETRKVAGEGAAVVCMDCFMLELKELRESADNALEVLAVSNGQRQELIDHLMKGRRHDKPH